ncbi:MAG: response regulator, partial [Myxococcales bacterium]|nr:response regulator [Myxococcales bacterium]
MDKLEGETGTAAVLVVEDEALFRDSVCTALSRSGYAVRSAATVQDAVQALAASVPDVLVLDVSLPDGSAEDVLEDLRRRQGSTKVLVVTGTYDGDRWANLEDDVELIVPKPISINTVRKMVGRLLQPLPRTTERFARRCSFSPRESQMLQLATEGLNDKEVTAELGCS